jgi:NitT/TauT family transport system substrate-binding protein
MSFAGIAATRLRLIAVIVLGGLLLGCGPPDSTPRVRIPTGAGGVGFLPLLMMREHGLVEKHAADAGLEALDVQWIDLGGPSVMNDALISRSVDFIIAGPPGFLTLWDRTRESLDVRGVAAVSALPMYLNTRAPHLQSIDDIGSGDKIALTAVKVSIPAIIMQMYAAERYGADEVTRFDRYTVSLTHPDGVVSMLAASSDVTAHFTSPPFHQRERQDPGIRTIMSSNDVMGGATTFTMLSTTAAYREANPEAYAAVLGALEEAMRMIEADRLAAADVLIAARGDAGLNREALAELLADPDIEFTTTPANTMRYAEFMHSIGSLENRPSSWRDLFFPEIHDRPGS